MSPLCSVWANPQHVVGVSRTEQEQQQEEEEEGMQLDSRGVPESKSCCRKLAKKLAKRRVKFAVE